MEPDEDPFDAWGVNCPRPPPSDAGLSAASYLGLHPLFQVAGTIVDHIHDYPTLICLAMTCHTFHSLIHNSRTKLPEAFSNLELLIPEDRSSSSGPGLTLKDDEHSPPYCSPIREDKALEHYTVPAEWNRQPNGDFTCNYDILRHNYLQLRTLDWLPCYGCRRIKRRATSYFPDQTGEHHKLLACSALDRRCISCTIGEAWRFDKPMRYVQDMPKGLAGYRVRCGNCRNIEWALQRPTRTQQMRKLCSVCYRNLRAEEEPALVLRREWCVLAGMPVEPARVKAAKDAVAIDAEEEVDGSILAGEYRSWCRFEVLDIEAG